MIKVGRQMTGNIGVVVLGMGRSGTSAVTRMFVSTGFFAGCDEDLMPATVANPTGHWENLCIWRANENVLNRLGGSWFDPPEASSQLAARAWAEPMLRSELERIDRQANDAPVVLKDPRIGVMMPLWGPILQGHLHPVLVVRDPLEIALSLFRRDGTPVVCGLAAWELHMTMLLDQLTDQPVTVAPYARLVYDSQLASSIVEMAVTHIDQSRASDLRPSNASSAFHSNLHRNRTAPDAHQDSLSRFQLDLWRFLSKLPAGNQMLDAPLEFRSPSRLTPQTIQSETQRIARNERYDQAVSDLSAAQALTTQLANNLSEEQQRGTILIAELQAERVRLETLATTYSQTERVLASIEQSASWRVTAPLRKLRAFLSSNRFT